MSNKHQRPQIRALETARLLLREYRAADARPLFERWGKDPESTRYMCMTPLESAADAQRFVAEAIAEQEPGYYRWVIEPAALGQPVGIIELLTLREHDNAATVAYSLGPDYWGKGYAAEALGAVLEFGLREAGYNRIEAYHATANPASGAVMRKAGMRYEGRAREKYFSNAGRYEDSDMYGILASDLG